MYQLVNGEVSVSKLRDVEVEDLLGRDPIEVDIDSILGYVNASPAPIPITEILLFLFCFICFNPLKNL